MFFGLDVEKLVVLGLLAAVILGPEKLPGIARSAAHFLARARGWAQEAKARVKEEIGDDATELEWRALDPRQYDPRRIIRQALLEEPAVSEPTVRSAVRQPDLKPDPKPDLEPARDRVEGDAS
ncbi:MAG: Sec-independent protein translocase TatB [Microbacterium sp.]|nr:MAG: Sec-independent protein translocase TatB [Microbacterium sp.]PZU38359.1 MAG: Sec-independent protein translocase TatB [Microbacterium sp.]